RNLVIDDSRNISQFLQTNPLEREHKFVVILQADALNLYAQQALLKTIEEPPHYAKIIVHTSNSFRLLSTIRSRLSIVRIADQTPSNEDKIIPQLQQKSISQLIDIASKHTKSREEALHFTDSLIAEMRTILRDKPSKVNLYNLTRC